MPLLTNHASRLLGGGRLAAPVPVLGAEKFSNTGFDADANWTKGAGWTIVGGVGVHTPGAGAGNLTQDVVVNNTWYLHQFSITRRVGTAKVTPRVSANFVGQFAIGTYYTVARGTVNVQAGMASDNGADIDVDNLSLKPITLASMFSTRPYTTHATTKAMCTIVAGTRAGVVCNLDSATSPANFVIASHDGTTARLTVCVAGVYTEKISQAVAYSAGAYVEIRRLAATNTFQLWYAGSQVGTDQTIADVTVISNTLAGMFQTYAGNTLAGFSCVPSV